MALIAARLCWGFITGFYSHELPILFRLLGVGALLSRIGQRMLEAAKKDRIEHRIAERDAVFSGEGPVRLHLAGQVDGVEVPRAALTAEARELGFVSCGSSSMTPNVPYPSTL